MKKTVLTLGILTLSLMATDFSSMTTEELINLRGTVAVADQADFRAEMQSRVSNMTTEERASFRASRQASSQMTPPTFATIDKDGDGKITQTELDTARADRMAQQSADGKALKNVGNAPTLASIDTNGDGTIDATEFASHQTAQMASRTAQQPRGLGVGQGSGAGSMTQGAGQGMGRGMGHNR
jgi:hypothetical protein